MADLDKIKENVQLEYDKLTRRHTQQLFISMVLPRLMTRPIQSSNSPGSTAGTLSSYPKMLTDRIITADKSLNPREFMSNVLFADNPAEVYNTFNNAQLSNLSPHVNFFMMDPAKNNKITPIPLQNMHPKLDSTSVGSPLLTSQNYSFLGLKDISIRLNGDSLETAKVDIDCQVTFYGNSLAIFREDNSPYFHLIYPGYKNNSIDRSLIMQVGWNEITAAAQKALNYTNAQVNAIRGQLLTLHMDYNYHSFNFNEDGSFTMTVEYTSYMETTNKALNFMELPKEVLKKVYASSGASKKLTPAQENLVLNHIRLHHRVDDKTKKMIYKYFERANNAKSVVGSLLGISSLPTYDDNAALAAIIKHTQSMLSEQAQAQMSRMFLTLKEEDKQFSFFATTNFINETRFKSAVNRACRNFKVSPDANVPGGSGTWYETLYGAFQVKYSLPELRTSGTVEIRQHKTIKINARPVNEEPQTELPDTVANPDEHGQTFVYYKFGDLLASFIAGGAGDDTIQTVLEGAKMKYVLGNIEIPMGTITTDATKGLEIISLYDLPISHQAVSKMIQKRFTGTKKTHVNASKFIAAMFALVQKYYLTGNAALDPGKVNKYALRSNQLITDKDLPDVLSKTNLKAMKLGEIRPNVAKNEKDNLYRYMIFNAADHPASISKEGLDRYNIGAANSVIKKVSYQATQDEIRQAWVDENIVNSYMDSDAQIVPQMYDCRIDLVGNIRFFPGYTFVLFPFIIGMSLGSAEDIATKLGLTGVYTAHSVEHRISESGFTTTITKSFNVTANSRKAAAKKKGP